VSGYPLLICAFLEAAGLGWIYGDLKLNTVFVKFRLENEMILFQGIKRIKENLKAMLGSYPNIFWVICFVVTAPIITFVNKRFSSKKTVHIIISSLSIRLFLYLPQCLIQKSN